MDYKDDNVTLLLGDCLERMKELEDNSVDSIVTDPPYAFAGGFMGKDSWHQRGKQVSACDTCRSPGSCCSYFVLNLKFKRDNWREDALLKLKEHNLELFEPTGIIVNDLYDNLEYVQCYFICSKLGSDGRCSDYNSRPDVCKRYEPRSDLLCCEYPMNFKGIRIIKEGNAT